MSQVCVHNEWDPLEEVVIGTVRNARVPRAAIDLHAVEFGSCPHRDDIPSGVIDPGLAETTAVELERLCDTLSGMGITVRRPGDRPVAATFSTPDWSTEGLYDYCPRDVLLAIGDTVIETPMVLRSRFLEPFAYKDLLIEYFCSGARWLSAPKPRLPDAMYDPAAAPGQRLKNLEPAFDAANTLRFGTDILYLVSDSGNEMGGQWLQSALGSAYRVHLCRGIYASTHVDSTIVPLRPGLVLLNPERVNDANIPDFLRSWDHIYAPPMAPMVCLADPPRASAWIGMNLLMIDPALAIVDDRQPDLIRLLEKHGIDAVPLRLTHARSLGGGFHCVSLDVRRRGTLESYT